MKKKQLIKALALSAVLAAFPAAGLSASAEDAVPVEVPEVAQAPVAVAADVVTNNDGSKNYDFEGATSVGAAVDKVVTGIGDTASEAVNSAAAAAAADAAQKVADAAAADEADADKAAADKAVELINGDAAPAADNTKTEDDSKTEEKSEEKTDEKADEKSEEKKDEKADADAKAEEKAVEDAKTAYNPFPINVPTETTAKLDKELIKAGETGKVTAEVKPGFTITGYDENGKAVIVDKLNTGVRFFSSDNSIATVDNDGTIHAKKEGKVTIWVETTEGLKPVTLDISESYNVLLIDKSESVKGKGLAKEKAAAISYADEVLKVNKESHVAVIAMGSETTTKTLSGWTSNMTDIKNIINGIKAEGGSVYSEALHQAGALLNSIPYSKQNYNKNIVMFSDGADTYGDRAHAKAVLNDLLYDPNFIGYNAEGKPVYETDDKGNVLYHRDTTTNFYAFGVYDSATKDGKKDGEGFLKELAANKVTPQRVLVKADGTKVWVPTKEDITRTDDHYYEVTSVKDVQKTFQNIATKKVYLPSKVDSLIGFDVYVYGKASSTSDSKSAKAKKGSNEDSPKTADCSGIYTIALFALLGAGAAAFTAKKRFED